MRKKSISVKISVYAHAAKRNVEVSHKNMLFSMSELLPFQCELQAQGRTKIVCGVKRLCESKEKKLFLF